MNRREFLKGAIAGAGALATASSWAAENARSAAPNIVLLISDDHGWADYGFMGHPHIRTPNLDRLASQSIVHPRGYVTSPLCCPSLATIITGKFVHEHGIVCNEPPGTIKKNPQGREQLCKMIEREATLPRILGRRNYISFQAGKWWLGSYSRGGFTAGMTHGDVAKGGRHGDVGLTIGRKTMNPVLDFVAGANESKRPFFLWYAPMLPHAPHDPAQRLIDKYRDKAPSLAIARYWANVEFFDETCGTVLDVIDRQGMTDNTIVLYVADNGVAYTDDGKEYRSKRTPYDMGVRTPMMVRWPEHVKPGRSDVPASSIDICTTALAAAGVERPADVAGVNLLDDRAVRSRGAVFGGAFDHDAVTLDDPAANLQSRYVVDGQWKLIAHFDRKTSTTQRVELYSILDDPHEKKDISADRPAVVQELMAKLDQWWRPEPRQKR